MSAPILRRGAAVVVASAIAGTAGTAGIALAGPAAATPAPNGHRVIVVVERGHEFCRFGHRTVVIIVKKDHGRVIVIRKIVRCDVRRHHDFFFRHHFEKHVEFRRAHRFNVDNNRVHVILPKTPMRVTTPTAPPQVSVRTGPTQVSVHTVPAQPNAVGPSHVSISGGSAGVGAGNTSSAGTGGINVGSGASDFSVGSGGISARG